MASTGMLLRNTIQDSSVYVFPANMYIFDTKLIYKSSNNNYNVYL